MSHSWEALCYHIIESLGYTTSRHHSKLLWNCNQLCTMAPLVSKRCLQYWLSHPRVLTLGLSVAYETTDLCSFPPWPSLDSGGCATWSSGSMQELRMVGGNDSIYLIRTAVNTNYSSLCLLFPWQWIRFVAWHSELGTFCEPFPSAPWPACLGAALPAPRSQTSESFGSGPWGTLPGDAHRATWCHMQKKQLLFQGLPTRNNGRWLMLDSNHFPTDSIWL